MSGLGLGLGLLRPRRSVASGWNYDLTSGSLPPVLSVARATSGSRVAASGLIEILGANAARFDYDPVALTCRGLLLEPQTTYFGAPSDDLVASPWLLASGLTNTNTAAASPLSASDTVNRFGGGSQAFSAVQYSTVPTSATMASHWLIRNVDAVASRVVYRDNVTAVQVNAAITWASATAGAAITNVVPSTGAGVTIVSSTAQDFGSGWWLVTVIFTTGALNGANVLRFDPAQTTIGRSVDVAAAWGGYSSAPMSYLQIPSSTPVTRDGDVITLSDTSKQVEFTYTPLGGGAAQTVTVAAGAQPASLFGRITRVRQLP